MNDNIIPDELSVSKMARTSVESMSDIVETFVATPDDLLRCCEEIAKTSVFGFDTEFIGEAYFRPRLCLVQVATPNRLYLIDPLAIEDLTPFWELVADPSRITVVHAGREEIRICAHQLGRYPANIFDVQIAAGLVGIGYPTSHAAIVRQVLRARIAKGETLTDWSRRPLTKHQIRYAFDDVRYLLPLYENLSHQLKHLNRQSWADEEFQMMQNRSLDNDPDREPWRKLRGLTGLDRLQLAVVREIHSWREERASVVNRPARHMLRDDLIIEVARRQPISERDLTVIRGVTRHDIAGLLAAVDRGIKTHPDERPSAMEREADPPQVAMVTSFVLAAVSSHCVSHSLTPGLAVSSQDIRTIVRARMAGQQPPTGLNLTRGWRADHILPLVIDLLEGRRNVQISSIDSAAPFHISDVAQKSTS